MSLLPSSPKIIASAPQIPENNWPFSPDPENPWGPTSYLRKRTILRKIAKSFMQVGRVKSGIFGQTAKFGQPPCMFHSSIIGMKINKLSKTAKIRLIWISTVCKRVSEFT